MDLGRAHVVAACLGLLLGAVVLLRSKGGAWHTGLGRAYLAALLVVNAAALAVYDATGLPGPFHVLAVVSLATTGAGWLVLRRGVRGRRAVRAHGTLMTWSWVGVVTAGLAQLAAHLLPERAPWPVVTVVALATAVGAIAVPRVVTRELARR